ncbi:LacI family DNA-binding transcriptional regulator [Marisediminicola sp. LYQ134]|uniref:LacI family DNA-binding transcriptional regulator n=1 Tax=unclassified Marisediminicola TaxID=2618316 RepID=UPI0039830B09
MIPRSQDVADRAGVSRSTVSQILNGHEELFTEETRARVADAVAELGYHPSAAGRTLARGSSDLVIVLVPNTTFGGNLQDIYGALTSALAERGLTLLLRLSEDSVESLARLATGLKPRAVLTLTGMPEGQKSALKKRGVEVIQPDARSGADVNAQIGAIQARHLIDKGYRKLAYAHLQDERTDPFGTPRELEFADECRRRGVPDPRVLHLGVTPESAAAALDDLGERGFAVACYNDDVATALLYAATQRGWSVPEDLALIGMDNTPLSRLTIPPLTTVGYDASEVLAASLRSLLRGLDKSDDAPIDVDVRVEIVERASA